jgi:hypothetical protein
MHVETSACRTHPLPCLALSRFLKHHVFHATLHSVRRASCNASVVSYKRSYSVPAYRNAVMQCSQQNFIVSTYDSFEKFNVKFGQGTFIASRCTSIARRMHLFLDSTETTRQ